MTGPARAPTDAELHLLRLLWSLGPSTVRAVHRALSSERNVGYTTVLKMLQVMHGKGLVVRDTSERSHVYTPVHSAEDVERTLVRDLLDKAFDGSASRLVQRALGDAPVDADEIARIRSMLDAWEER